MASRLELQTKLEELLDSANVYYQPPETIKINYPAIVYVKSNIKSTYANDGKYTNKTSYEVTVVDKKPDNSVIDALLALPLCKYDRHYVADNLHHDTLTLYF